MLILIKGELFDPILLLFPFPCPSIILATILIFHELYKQLVHSNTGNFLSHLIWESPPLLLVKMALTLIGDQHYFVALLSELLESPGNL